MKIAARALVTLALAASVSIGASAFNPSAFVKNVAGKNTLAGKAQLPLPTK